MRHGSTHCMLGDQTDTPLPPSQMAEQMHSSIERWLEESMDKYVDIEMEGVTEEYVGK